MEALLVPPQHLRCSLDYKRYRVLLRYFAVQKEAARYAWLTSPDGGGENATSYTRYCNYWAVWNWFRYQAPRRPRDAQANSSISPSLLED